MVVSQIQYIDHHFYNNISFLQILAGIFASKIKFNKKYVSKTQTKIYHLLQKFVNSNDEFASLFSDGAIEYIKSLLKMGYDEIELMEMFFPFYLVP
jgi:hypothetical protein